MARIIVTNDAQHLGESTVDGPFLMDERVESTHLEDEHCSLQVIERMAWAVAAAEDLEPAL